MKTVLYAAAAALGAVFFAHADQKDANGLSWPDGSQVAAPGGQTTRHCFTCAGCEAWVEAPVKARPGNPWVWVMEWPDAFGERTGQHALVKEGYYCLYLKVGYESYGSPRAMEQMDEFYRLFTARGLAKKGVVTGVSRGGLYAWRFASRGPGRVAGIVGDAPCCDLKSYPVYVLPCRQNGLNLGEYRRVCSLFGFKTPEEFASFRGNPVGRETLKPIAAAGIPALHVIGEADSVVPPEYNSDVLEKHFRELGGKITVIRKPGCDHHPHGLDDPKPIVDFVNSLF